MRELEADIIKLNQDQLRIGEDSDGIKLPEYSSLSYMNYKSRKGSKSLPNYDLYDEGGFYNKMFGKLEGEDYRVDSKDKKRDIIVNTLTSIDIFGFQDKTTVLFIKEKFYPLFMKKLRTNLFLN